MRIVDFFAKTIKDTEVNSLLLADATEMLMEKTEKSGGYLEESLQSEIYQASLPAERIAAWLVLFAKYSNAKEAIIRYETDKCSYPIYAELADGVTGKEVTDSVVAWMEKAECLEGICKSTCDDVMQNLELQPMPVVSSKEAIFESIAAGEQAPRIAVLLKHDMLAIKYDAASYLPRTIQRAGRAYLRILQGIKTDQLVADIDMLDSEMCAELKSFHDNTLAYDNSLSVVDLLERAITQYPERIAVVYKEKRLTYRELGELTDKIAAYIHSKGIGAEDVVSILVDRSHFMPAAAIGVLKAGAAYQPLDSSYPKERLIFMMKDAKASLLIADKRLAELVSDYHGEVLLTDDMAFLSASDKSWNLPSRDSLFVLLYTSGSTGVPKGVMLEHRNLVAFIRWYVTYYAMDENSRAVAYASFGFDANMMDMYPVLTAGGELHIVDDDIRLDLLRLKEYFEKNQITHSFITTQVGRQYAQMFDDAKFPRYFSIGGEALAPLAPPTGYKFFNAYGPTECTIFSTIFAVDRLYQNVPIGKALSNLHLYVVDGNLKQVPAGVPGELCIAGPQVARGYLNLKQQTEAAFVANPYETAEAYCRMYRTGDIVRFLSDGNIEFIGRRDSQVKIRGFRIELSEVEAIIRAYAPIKDAAVVAYDAAAGGKYIVAYIVSEEEVDIARLNDFIKESKPSYMVPAVTMQIDKIPLNQNQKVDKRALPRPERKLTERVLPANGSQMKIYELLKTILAHDEFGITTSFAEAGLTSVTSLRFIVELTRKFGVPVTIRDVQKYNTVADLSDHLSLAKAEDIHEERDRYPLTQTQLGIYVECLRNPDSTLYNLPVAFALDKDTDMESLKQAIHTVMDAHESMKCFIHEDEDGNICMYPQPEREFDVEVAAGSQESWEEYFAHYAVPFAMAKELPFRFTLYKTEEHLYFILDFHHIVSDGTSIALFIEELNRVLLGEKVQGEFFSQYDAAVWEEKKRAGEDYEEAKAFYDAIYKEQSAEHGLKGDLAAKDEGCGFYKAFDGKIAKEQVEAFCRKHKITENVFFTAVMGYVMGKCNHSEDAVFTTIYNGRNDSRMMNSFGMFVKTLPVYSYCSKDTAVADYLKKMQGQLMDSMRHDIYSFGEISNAYHIKPEIMFVYQGDTFVEAEIGGQKTAFYEAVPDRAKANISLNIFVENGKYRYEFEYMSHVYSERYIERLYDICTEAAKGFLVAKTLGEVSVLSEKEAAKIEGFNATDYPVSIKGVHRLFEEWAEKIPQQTAVIACGEKLTYQELNEKANLVAGGLLKRGLECNTLVGVILRREKNVYIVRQGILKAGGGFLPLVTEYPDERMEYCLRDGGCRFVITTKEIKRERAALFVDKPYTVLTVEELLADGSVSKENPNLDIDVSNVAYCLYTSGSTGKPKGVMIEHKTLCNFVNSNPKNIEVENYTKNGKVSLAFAAITFDVSVMEEFIPLANGMTICMANEDEIHNPLALAKLLLTNHVDIMKCTPSFMMSIVELPEMAEALGRIKAFDIGAEPFPVALYDKMRAVNSSAAIINSYGPTECTISCTSKLLVSSGEINIGGPLANMKLYVADEAGNSLPVGISGELIICGAGVGRGYRNLSDKTKKAFFTYRGLPAYRSGDLVQWNEKGEIVFLGRMDNQVKLRGLRIELDEVEHAICSFEGIKACKVLVKKAGNDEYLAAYFTAAAEIGKDKLMDHARLRLPSYMVPGAMMQLEEMPLNNHGKIDKKRLPEIAYDAKREYVAPKTPLEAELCEKYREILSLEQVGATDNFFEIGGTSLSAAKVVMYCNFRGYHVVYRDIFANPSPQMLARLIAGEPKAAGAANGDPYQLKSFDYDALQEILAGNVYASTMQISRCKIKSVLLTGATGFLGIHVLRELLRGDYHKIYCMVRKGKFETCKWRLDMLYMYYFGNVIPAEAWDRMECIDADITEENIRDKFKEQNFDFIINCAACVKHFVQGDLLDRINVQGVENLIKLALHKDAALLQISTVSVAGMGNADTVPCTKLMQENELYFGQILENDYIRTKFLAERAILSAIKKDGLRAKIVRVGNLMSRRDDGEFQINFVTNGFMRSLKAYKTLGKFPVGKMHSLVEFSPIDSTAGAVVALMHCDEKYTVFHAYNSHKIFMSDVIYSMNDYGFAIEIVPDALFSEAVHVAKQNDALSDTVLGLIAYNSSDEMPSYELGTDNRFTAEVLYRMHYKWPITDDEYLRKSITALDTLGFFE